MKKINIYKIAIGFAMLLLIISLIFVFTGKVAEAGPSLILFFFLVAVAVRGFHKYKGFFYTI